MEFIIGLLIDIVVGGAAGFVASKLMKKSNGIIMDIILGIVGGIVAGVIFGILGLGATSFIGGFIVSVIGAVALIFVYDKFIKK